MIFSIFIWLSIIFANYNTNAMMSNAEFCYNRPHCDPSTWEGTCKTGIRQSPIGLTLDSNTSITYPQYTIQFSANYFKSQPYFYIQNNGHTVQVHLENSENFNRDSPFFAEGPDVAYVLAQIHLHWGNGGNDIGSEHTINNQQYPMEIHMVHYSTQYQNLNEALAIGSEDAVTVLGLFVEINSVTNLALKSITQGVVNLLNLKPEIGEIVKIEQPLNLYELIPNDNLLQVFRYRGSLTTPPCTEKVRWVVFRKSISISENELLNYINIPDSEAEKLVNNFRPVQPLVGRIVEFQNLR